jgi:transcriptional regulator with XRE-family HTH domain
MSDTVYVSDFLRDRRVELELRPAEVASMIGVSLEIYRYWESRGQLHERYFQQIATALDVSIDKLEAEATATKVFTPPEILERSQGSLRTLHA